MKLTQQLKNWLTENCGVKADASEDEFKKAAGEALVTGKLTTEKFAELSKNPDAERHADVQKQFDRLAEGLDAVVKALQPKPEEKETKVEEKAVETKEEPKEKKALDMEKKIADIGGDPNRETEARVKSPLEMYDSTTTELRYPERTKNGSSHPFAGQRAKYRGIALDELSPQKQALAGIWSKYQIYSATPRIAGSPQRAWELFNEHEKALLHHLAEKETWEFDDLGMGSPRQTRGYSGGLKALIDDSTSGGLEAAPIVFDENVIQAPVLYGELYPLVNEVPLARGRRVEGVATGRVTIGWGGVDDTAISLFNTASYVSAFDTSIHRGEGAIRVGMDFLSDTPINFAAHINAQYGEALLQALDNVIATGNGTTQPEGVMNKSGTTSVAFGGATSLSAYESLMSSVAKAELATAGNSAVFCGTYTSYHRAIGLPVSATDTRRVFGAISGPNYDGYAILQKPYKISTALANTQLFFAVLNKYRMYRRRGLTIRTSTEGDTLIRNNEMLISVTFRYGGQLERAACAAVSTTAPA